jgi:hypothetical protein
MKKHLMAVITAVGLLAMSSVGWGQTAVFSYNDGNGTPNAGSYHPGDSFTFSITLAFTAGGTVANLDGLSYWMQQLSPGGGPFIASITLRDVTGSDFSDLQTPGLMYPQTLNPANANDLGAAIPAGNPADGNGSYLIANITIKISDTAPGTGVFVLDNTTSGGKTSVISDSNGHTFAIPEADYTITMVPEPGTWAGATLALLALVRTQRRRISKLWHAT